MFPSSRTSEALRRLIMGMLKTVSRSMNWPTEEVDASSLRRCRLYRDDFGQFADFHLHVNRARRSRFENDARLVRRLEPGDLGLQRVNARSDVGKDIYTPTSLLSEVAVTPVATLLNVNLAPGIAAPVVSVTAPVRAALILSPRDSRGQHKQKSGAGQAARPRKIRIPHHDPLPPDKALPATARLLARV